MYTISFSQDIPVNPERDFPDIHVDVTGSHGQKIFGVDKSHGRIYLPEQLLERENGPRCRDTRANEEARVAGCLEENMITKGMTREELFEQQAAYRNFEVQKAEKESVKNRGRFQKSMPGEFQQCLEARKQLEQEIERNERMEVKSPNSIPREIDLQHVQPLKQNESVRDLDLSSSDAEALLGILVCLRNEPGREGVGGTGTIYIKILVLGTCTMYVQCM